MTLRLVEMVLPEKEMDSLEDLLIEHDVKVTGIWVQPIKGLWKFPVEGVWQKKFLDGYILVRILLFVEETQHCLDLLEENFSGVEGFRINLLPVEASVPTAVLGQRVPPVNGRKPPQNAMIWPGSVTPEGQSRAAATRAPSNEKEAMPEVAKRPRTKLRGRISTQELYADISGTARLTNVYVVTVVLSSIVAAIGILNNNVAVIIGAMVIAPLLGPNVALSLATTLGDPTLAKNALKTNVVGLAIALILSTLLGLVLMVDPSIPEIASRTRVGLVDVALALASGCAGALAFTTGVSATLIGVMVAVALLPPLVTFGLLLGSGQSTLAFGALLLFLINLICVNLAGVATFLAQGIFPRTWWEAEVAKTSTMIALLLWVLLLVALVGVIVISQRV